MNIQLLRALMALQTVPAPDPQPESLQPKPPWEGDDVRPPEPVVVEIGEPYAPTFHAPPRGRVVSQATGPNRQQWRRR